MPMLMTWLRCALSWLAVLFSRSSRTGVVAGAECAHDADPDALMRRLLRAVNDPQSFAEILAEFGDCRGCSMAVVAQFTYTLAGIALDQDQVDDDQPQAACTCDHAVCPEVIALRLVLTYKDDNVDSLIAALAEVDCCRWCLMSVVMALVHANVSILDDTKAAWQPVLQRRLLSILDQLAAN